MDALPPRSAKVERRTDGSLVLRSPIPAALHAGPPRPGAIEID